MSRGLKLVFILAAATVMASVGSHLLARWVKIKTTVSEPLIFGQPNGRPPAFRAGSSLADYQINWEQIATQTGTEIKAWGVAAGSPYEFEQFQKLVPEAQTTYIVISAFDMDEANISDFRAAVVPLSRAIESLKAVHADWNYSKRALSQYPMTWLRVLFPTFGRSRAIMGMLHEKMVNLIRHPTDSSRVGSGPTLEVGKEKGGDQYTTQRVSDWSEPQIVGKLAAVRAAFQGSDAFNCSKFLALERMLQYGCQRGRTIVIVVPVSATYSKAFMPPELTQAFETAIAGARRQNPKVEWLRLDQVPGLDSDENFCDLVHMNIFGKRITTQALQNRLEQPPRQP